MFATITANVALSAEGVGAAAVGSFNAQ
ncbi:hypothetical protein PF008_g28366, partial [Phytophthora fragariae]